jgi:hypothetical protein
MPAFRNSDLVERRRLVRTGFGEVKAMTTEKLTEFFRQGSFYLSHPGFEVAEREYKIRLSNALAKSQELIGLDPSQAILVLRRALLSKDNNIISWRDNSVVLDWLKLAPIDDLQMLWNEDLDLETRLGSFCRALVGIGLSKPGAQLTVTSTLLMALSKPGFLANSKFDFPPVRTDSFSRAMDLAGWDTLHKLKDPVQRYMRARSFMDAMIERSEQFGIHDMQDRLDAQGVIWCVAGGWPTVPVPPSWVNDPADRARALESTYYKYLRDLRTEPGDAERSVTEKEALVKARRGQREFREKLLFFWDGCCAVTECRELKLLRASHIRPWKSSENAERLDRYNGLLLVPNLDAAFDKGLITFDDGGEIIISRLLNSNDRTALGIRQGLRLRNLSPQHLPYLRHHRGVVFLKSKKAQNKSKARDE